jgi:hypothetical protein
MAVDVTACTFDEVMLDWAIAEVLSPDAWQDFYRSLGAPFRERVGKSRDGNLSAADRALLLRAVRYVRQPLIELECGITESWKFSRCSISAAELGSYSIIHHYSARYGGISFGDFAAMVRDRPFEPEMRMRASIMTMLQLAQSGVRFTGRPIAAIRTQRGVPLLIEGYKRSMVAVLSGAPSIEVSFCQPD